MLPYQDNYLKHLLSRSTFTYLMPVAFLIMASVLIGAAWVFLAYIPTYRHNSIVTNVLGVKCLAIFIVYNVIHWEINRRNNAKQ
jgi:hypothetical protein